MRNSRSGGLAAMLALAAMGAGVSIAPGSPSSPEGATEAREVITRTRAPSPTPIVKAASFAEIIRRVFGGDGSRRARAPRWPQRPPGTNARTQRAARKHRNVLRNRKAHRG